MLEPRGGGLAAPIVVVIAP